jgi:hypothetical protein
MLGSTNHPGRRRINSGVTLSKMSISAMKLFQAVLLVLVIGAGISCSNSASIDASEKQVALFHKRLSTEQYFAIYAATSSDFKNITKEGEFVHLLAAIHRKLGLLMSTDRAKWTQGYNNGGIFVTLIYKSQFQHGSADEQFIFRIEHGTPELAGYHINSNALITN